MTKTELEALLDKYLSGQAEEREKQLLNEWYYSFNDETVTVPLETANEKQILKNRLMKKLDIEPIHSDAISKKGIVRNLYSRFKVGVAAAIVVAVATSIFFIWQNSSNNRFTRHATANNQVLRTTLPDGSIVVLNGGSTLKYSNDFNQLTRTVYLEGEGFFEVVPNATKPFKVVSGKLGTQVLGTSFNVKAYPNEKQFNVTVVTGRVAVGLIKKQLNANKIELDQKLVLKPNEKFMLNTTNETYSKKNLAEAASISQWQKGDLVFDETPMHDVARQLERTHNIKISFENIAIENCLLVGKFPHRPVEQTLDWICTSIGTKYKKEGSVYMITGEGCK